MDYVSRIREELGLDNQVKNKYQPDPSTLLRILGGLVAYETEIIDKVGSERYKINKAELITKIRSQYRYSSSSNSLELSSEENFNPLSDIYDLYYLKQH